MAVERQAVGSGVYESRPDGATCADAAAGFLRHTEHVKGREYSTLRGYRNSIRGQLNRRWGDPPVASILPADVAAMRDELLAAGLAPRTVVCHMTVGHGVFKQAAREHGLARNPASAELWIAQRSGIRASS